LAGLAKKLFVPLALTVAVAMIASYFVSMCVTPVACQFFLGHLDPKGFWKKIEHAIDRLAEGYAKTLRRVLPLRATILVGAAVLVVVSAVIATRLPSTFFPDTDEAMETIYVRFTPGTSIEQSADLISRMGKALSKELPNGSVEMVLSNIGSPANARAIITSPNWGPHMGFLRADV